MSCDMGYDHIVSNNDGYVYLMVATRYSMSCTWSGGVTTCRGSYTTSVRVVWGDGSTTVLSRDDYGTFPCGYVHLYHQYSGEGPYTISITETYYSNISSTYFTRSNTISSVVGSWKKWQADCGDTPWDANGNMCCWNGNYGICWLSNNFTLSIMTVYNMVASINWAFTIMGMAIDELFDLWYGETWQSDAIRNYNYPWSCNWSYWNGNEASLYPWNWWFTNWAPGFSGPGRIGKDVNGVFHPKEDPLLETEICIRNGGDVDVYPGFSAAPTSVTVGHPVQFTDESVNMAAVIYGFGDGHNTSERNPIHAYRNPGIYSVTQMCYHRTDIPVIPVFYTKERYITVYAATEKVACSFTPVPSSWTLAKAMNAMYIYADVNEPITFYFDGGGELDQVLFYPGLDGVFDTDSAIFVEDPGGLQDWKVTVSYPHAGWVYPYGLFSQAVGTKYGSYQFRAGIRIGTDEEAGDPPEEIPDPEEPPVLPGPTPPPAYMHRYVRLDGSDWNDGLTWETAMETWKAALDDIPVGGWLHVDYDDYRHQEPVIVQKSVVIVPQEDYREVGLYKKVIMPGHGKTRSWWPW